MKRILIILPLLLFTGIACRPSKLIPPDKGLDVLLLNGAMILDVRTETEYKNGHIEGAINISLGTIRERYIELDSSKTYITTCSHGFRSVKVKNLLIARGFKHVYNGGTWSDLNKIVIRKKD